MAGSLRYFSYEDDNALLWNVNLDENVYEQNSLRFGQNPSPVAASAGRKLRVSSKRGPISMRYALLTGLDQHDRLVQRKVFVGNITAPLWLQPTVAANIPELRDFSSPTTAQNLRNVKVSALVGETRRFIPSGDSGIIDGDIEVYT